MKEIEINRNPNRNQSKERKESKEKKKMDGWMEVFLMGRIGAELDIYP